MQCWPLQDAKAQLSKLIKCTLQEGPQGISVHGTEQVVVVPKSLYNHFIENQLSFIDFMKNSPLQGFNLDIERNKSETRDVDL